jgi:uncharacterized protein (TIGR00369 family)
VADQGKLSPLTELNRIIREGRVAEYQSPNLTLGMKPVSFESGAAKWEWPQQAPSALNPFGTIHGGHLAIFIDELFSTAIGSILETDEYAVTAEMKISFLRPLRAGALEGSARVLRRARQIAFLEAVVHPPNEQAAVMASSTWAITRVS